MGIGQVLVLIVCLIVLAYAVWAVVTTPPEVVEARRARRRKPQPQTIATFTGRRPTVVRTGLGLLLGGLPGALLGFAWRKKTRNHIQIP